MPKHAAVHDGSATDQVVALMSQFPGAEQRAIAWRAVNAALCATVPRARAAVYRQVADDLASAQAASPGVIKLIRDRADREDPMPETREQPADIVAFTG